MKRAFEVNFDGLVGPTHNYSGLSWGNEASYEYYNEVSNPQQAALQGLAKMKFMMDLGLKQGILPPQERPFLPALEQIGFPGTRESIINEAARYAPWAFRYVSSASSMWAANAATVTPSLDSAAKRVQFTSANLNTKFHRSLEARKTEEILRLIFENPVFFEHHTPLAQHKLFSDEGAANHTRLGKSHSDPGIHLFAYGNSQITDTQIVPEKYPARQSMEATQAITKLHQIYDKQVVLAQLNPGAIDAGVFHLDVILTGNENLLFLHEEAMLDQDNVLQQLRTKLEQLSDGDLMSIVVPSNRISLEQAVQSYLFNSQIITLPDGQMTMIAPSECLQIPEVASYLSELAEDKSNPIHGIHYINLMQSMKNGGGPACLRLRVILNDNEIEAMNQNFLLNDSLYQELVVWVKKHYRDHLKPSDLTDPKLVNESYAALDELTQIMNMGSIYDFQR